MSSLLQIRNVPEHTRRVLKARAATRGESLNSYLLALLEREASVPTLDEALAHIANRPEKFAFSAVDVWHEARAERERELEERIPYLPQRSDAG